MIGVNTHTPYTDGNYSNITQVVTDLEYIGVFDVRDSISNGAAGSALLDSYIQLAEAGVHFTFLATAGGAETTVSLAATITLIQQLEAAVPDSVTAVEGPNEINNQPITWNGSTSTTGTAELNAAIAFQEQLYSDVHSNAALAGVKVDNFTGGEAGTIPAEPDAGTTPGLADANTQHPYPNNGDAPAFWVSMAEATPGDTGPVVYTETGYSSNGGTSGAVNEDLQAKYTLDLLFDDAQAGVSQTYLYQLLDAYAPGSPQGDDGYGLFDSTGAAKPVATAIHNLTTILADNGSSTPLASAATNYSVTALPSDGNNMLIEKSDGTSDIVVWAEPQIWNESTGTEIAATATPVTVQLGGTYATVQIFDPLTSSTAIQTLSDVSSVSISLTDHPLIIQVGPQLSSAVSSSSSTAPNVVVSPLTVTPTTSSIATTDATSVSPFKGLLITDPNAGQTETATVSLSSTQNGTLTDPNAVTDGSTTTNGVWTLSGSAAQVTAALNSFVFTSKAHEVAPGSSVTTTLTATVTDSAGQSSSASSIVTATAVDSPITVTPATRGIATTDAASVSPFKGLVVTDPNAGQTETATVSLTGARGSPLNGTLTDPNAATDGSTTTNGVWTLSGSAAQVTAALNSFVFTPKSHEVAPGSSVATTFTANVTDSAGQSSTSTSIVTATAVASPITVTPATRGIAITDAASVSPFKGLVITDSNAGQTETATVSLTGARGSPLNGTLTDPNAAMDGSKTTNGVWTLSGSAAQVTAALNSFVFTPKAHEVAPGSSVATTFTANVTDSAGQSSTSTSIVTATAVASPITVTPAIRGIATTDAASVSPFKGLVITDPNAGQTQTATVSLTGTRGSPQNGTLTDPNAATDGSKTTNGVWTLSGSAAQVTAALNSFVFTPKAHEVAPGSSVVTTFTATVTDSAGQSSASTSTVTATAVASPVTVTLGSGPDTLALQMSEDAYAGDAQFTIAVNGTQIGGTQTATASHAAGASQTFNVMGSFTAASSATITFLNDAYGGTATTDRNLYETSATIDGRTISGAPLTENSSGAMTFLFQGSTTTNASSGNVVLNLSEDAYMGDAQFTVSIDGGAASVLQSVTALHSASASEAFSLGNLTTGLHDIAVSFTNDLYGGSATTDRNLYVTGISVNGTLAANSTASMLGASTNHFTIVVPH